MKQLKRLSQLRSRSQRSIRIKQVLQHMTLMEKWQLYCQDITSPDIFIEWGLYSIIASCLQRRVHIGDMHSPIFSNGYIILCGPPGVGKGLVIKEVKNVLSYHKLKQASNRTEQEKLLFAEKQDTEELLVPVGADASSYQALIRALSRSIRTCKMEGVKIPYMHSSLLICLEELSSLFRENTEDLVNFLLATYDCGNYRYDTIGRGIELIRNCCLNIMGGTTPSFIRRIFGDELLTDGFASRTFFIYATKNRFFKLRQRNKSQEQLEAYQSILDHIKALGNLTGEVKIDADADEYMLRRWLDVGESGIRANASPKLQPYYARWNLHLQKMAMIVHYMNAVDGNITLADAHQASDILQKAEANMHFAVTLDSANPLAAVTKDILRYIHANHKIVQTNTTNLLMEFYGELPEDKKSLETILEYLIATGQIEFDKENKRYIPLK